MSDNGVAHDRSAESLLAEAVDAFHSAARRGESPSVEDYAARYPDVADHLRRLLPALGDLEASDLSAERGLPGQDPHPGILGDFKLIGEIGRGGMGIVYEAVQISLNRPVALKVLAFAAMLDPKHLQRFRHEAQAAALLHHEHIVPVYAVGVERGVHYYAMQLIDGRPLSALIDQLRHERAAPSPGDSPAGQPASPAAATARVAAASTLPLFGGTAWWRRIAQLGVEAAEALEHAHSLGVVHRDVKPGNLLIDVAGKVWVADFGLARIGTDPGLTMSGDLLGTLRYMSPEQALAKHGLVDHRTDVYALGTTLYELLTLQPAVTGKDRQEILHRIAFEEPVPPRKLRAAVPAELETIVLKAMAKEPAQRYATAQELADDLRRWLGGESIHAQPPTLVQRLHKWSRRHRPVLTALFAAGVLALVALVAVSAWFNVRLQGEVDNVTKQETLGRRENDKYRHALYATQMQLARREWEGNRIKSALNLLDGPGCPADLRGWEWNYLHRLCHQELHSRSFSDFLIAGPYFAADGSVLVATKSGRIGTIWDVTTGVAVRTFTHPRESYTAAFSPDGRQLATADSDLVVRVWDVTSGMEIHTLRGHVHTSQALAFSPNGRLLASGGYDRTVRLWDLTTGRLTFTLDAHGPVAQRVAFSADSAIIAAGNVDGTIRLWSTATGLAMATLFGHTRSVLGLEFSPDGQLLASGGLDNTVRVWKLPDGRPIHTFVVGGGFAANVAFSPDGQVLATCGEDAIRLWNVGSGEEVRSLRGHFTGAARVVFSPNGRFLGSAGNDRTAKIWDLRDGPREYRSLTPRNGSFFAAPGDGQHLLVVCEDGSLRDLDATTLEPVATYQGPNGVIGLGPDARVLAALDKVNGLCIWDVASSRRLQTLAGHEPLFQVAAFSHDGRRFAVGGNGEVHLWDVESSRLARTLTGHVGVIRALAFSHDGRLLASSGHDDHLVKLCDLATGETIRELSGHAKAVIGIAFSQDDRLLATCSDDGTAKVWDMVDGQDIHTLSGHSRPVTAVAFSPDGRRIATAGVDSCVKLWDTASGQEVLTLNRFQSSVTKVAFSRDGRRMITAGGDGVRVWDAAE